MFLSSKIEIKREFGEGKFYKMGEAKRKKKKKKKTWHISGRDHLNLNIRS